VDTKIFDMNDIDIAWCPGCGNFPILKTLKNALAEMQIKPKDIVLVSGIGQAAKIPHYFNTNLFNGLHGRALPAATAIKAANPALTVIAESGDGDMYGEGGNHFIHTIRRNPNITNIVHNNMVYGLTKGQASPTSQKGFVTPVQVGGVFLEPFNPLAVAIALGASFVARAFSGDIEQTADILKKPSNTRDMLWSIYFSRASHSTSSIRLSGSRTIRIISKTTTRRTDRRPSRRRPRPKSCRSVFFIKVLKNRPSKRTPEYMKKNKSRCMNATSISRSWAIY